MDFAPDHEADRQAAARLTTVESLSGGLDRFPATRRALETTTAAGNQLGAQLFVSLRGETLVEAAIGEARPHVPLTPQHLLLWLSATKPLTAVAIAQQWERGRLGLDDSVAQHVPEFAVHGKERITIRHLLTHTGGIRMVDLGGPERRWDEVIALIAARRPEPNWIPGQKAGYHEASSWFLLAEIVRRLDGRAFERYAREEILVPLGMNDSWIGMPNEIAAAYRAEDRIATVWNTETQPPSDRDWDSDAHLARCSPAGGGWGPAADLGRFYGALLAGGRGVLRRETVEAITARHRVGLFDHTFKVELDWGLGFILDSKRHGHEGNNIPYGYGTLCSPRTYGHSGYRSAVAFADPEPQLAVAFLPNGTPNEVDHQARTRAVIEGIYRDLGLG